MELFHFRTTFFNQYSGYMLIKNVYVHFIVFWRFSVKIPDSN